MYELIKAGERTYYIECPTHIGIYVYENNDAVVIDSGNSKDYGKKILKHLNENGWTLKTVINTHSHADHIGGNALLQERTGCTVLCPGAAASVASHPVIMPSVLYGSHPPKSLRGKWLCAQPSDARELNDDTLPEGFEYVRLDGHAIAQAAIKTPDGVWFIGDVLVSRDTLEKYHISYLYDVRGYIDSLNKVKTLQGSLFVPAHAEVCADIAPLTDDNIAKTFELMNLIREICRKPMCSDDVIAAVFTHYGLTIDLMQYALSGSTVRSYIAYLMDEGEFSCVFDNNKVLWICEKDVDKS